MSSISIATGSSLHSLSPDGRGNRGALFLWSIGQWHLRLFKAFRQIQLLECCRVKLRCSFNYFRQFVCVNLSSSLIVHCMYVGFAITVAYLLWKGLQYRGPVLLFCLGQLQTREKCSVGTRECDCCHLDLRWQHRVNLTYLVFVLRWGSCLLALRLGAAIQLALLGLGNSAVCRPVEK